MRFLALAVFVAAAASCSLAQDVRELVNQANQQGAPFTSYSLKKLERSDAWGHKRANRTTDVAIMNPSSKSFQLDFAKCALGSLSSDLLPQTKLNSRTSTIFGMESSTNHHGVQCTLLWQDSRRESYFTVMLNNPYFGDNYAYTSSSYDLNVVPTLGHGDDNQAIILVQSKPDPLSMLSSSSRSQSGSSQQQRGGRNIAIKASKRGSRYHTL